MKLHNKSIIGNGENEEGRKLLLITSTTLIC